MAWFNLQLEKSEKRILCQTRIINDQSMDLFRTLLSQTDFTPVSLLCKEQKPNIAYDTFLDMLTKTYDKAFPLIQFNKKEHRTFKNPWMTKGLLKSCDKRA